MQVGDYIRWNRSGVTGKIIEAVPDEGDGWGDRLVVVISPDDVGIMTGNEEDIDLQYASSMPIKSMMQHVTKIDLSAPLI